MSETTWPAPEMTDSTLQSCLDALPLPALAVGVNERILCANSLAQALLGQTLSGRHFITILRQPSLLDAVEASLRTGEMRKARYLASEGNAESAYTVTCAPITVRQGAAVLVSFEDITAVEQAGQMRRDFVANVSHELRTPLTALLSFIETLRGPAREDKAARERFLEIMETEASRMNRLVGDLLSLNRVEQDERVRPTESVDLGALLAETLRGLAPLAEKGDVVLVNAAPGAGIVAPGDSDQLRQVFTNLIENAIKYGGPGTVTLQLERPEYEPALRARGVRITVADDGPGISKIHLPRITERFYRVDDHRSREMGGTGLGLAIVKHIISRHRGRLRIESEPGEGSRFTVVLPVF